MNDCKVWIAAAACLIAGAYSTAADRPMAGREMLNINGRDGRQYLVEELGRPVQAKDTPVSAVCDAPDKGTIVWGVVSSEDAFGVLGRGLENGKSYWVDLRKFGNSRAAVSGYGTRIFIVTGSPLKVLRYDVADGKLTEIRTYPNIVNAYWHDGYAVSADGSQMYVGCYPGTFLIGVDLKRSQAFDPVKVQNSPDQKYIVLPAMDDRGILFLPVGLARPELYTMEPGTGKLRQILTKEQQDALVKQRMFRPLVFLNPDGLVYMKIGNDYFRCDLEGLTPSERRNCEKLPNNLRLGSRKTLTSKGERAVRFGEGGLTVVRGSGARAQVRKLPVDYEPAGIDVFGAHEVRDGVLYGSSVFPGRIYAVDLRKMTGEDLGFLTNGQIQCYDIVNMPAGLVLSSYVGANLNFYDPAQPREAGKNPRFIRSLEKEHQERIQRLTRVGDHFVYGGTVPRKGAIGGGIMKLDMRDFSVQFWRNVIQDQSIKNLVALPESTLLCGGSSIEGGTGAKPVAKEAKLLLWDTASDRLVWHGAVVPGATKYVGTGVTADGKVLTFARMPEGGYTWVVFDPAKRVVTASGKVEADIHQDVYTQPEPMGPERKNYCFGSCWLGVYSPASGRVETVFIEPKLKNRSWQFLHIEPDGWMYFPLGTKLMRMKLF